VYALGIDLGTSNSVVAVYRRGRVEVLNIDGYRLVPSVVSLKNESTLLVGENAKRRVMLDPENTVSSIKRHMGDNHFSVTLRDKSYSPTDISALILKKIVESASAELGESIKNVVISVPAYFTNNQKEDTRKAGLKAGLNVLRLIPEPTAAAISYGLDKGKDQLIMIYDLGGGTFDISILEVKGNEFEVKALGGDPNLGGDDFDNCIIDYMGKGFKQQTGIDLFGADDAKNKTRSLFDRLSGKKDLPVSSKMRQKIVQILKEAAEKAKKELSEVEETTIYIPNLIEDHNLAIDLTRSQFEKIIQPLVNKTQQIIIDVLHRSSIDLDDIDRVVMVGGSTRIPLIKRMLLSTVKEPWCADNVDEVVAAGAAIVAANETAPEQMNQQIRISEITAHSLGIRVKKDGNPDLFEPIIPVYSPIPASITKTFKTIRNNQQAVEVAVFQGDSGLCSQNTFVGGFILDGIPPAQAQKMTVDVNFNMDISDILNVSASCQDRQNEFSVNVNKVADMNDLGQTEGGRVDIVFLIDTSGSMGRELDGVKRSCVAFASHIASQNIDCRLGLVDFDKPCGGGCYNYDLFALQTDVNLFKTNINKLAIGRIGGCGCNIADEDTLPVFKQIPPLFSDSNGRTKILIIISDEVGNNKACKPIINLMTKNDITVHILGVPGDNAHSMIAKQTNGKFWDIFSSRKIDFSAIFENIAQEIALTI